MTEINQNPVLHGCNPDRPKPETIQLSDDSGSSITCERFVDVVGLPHFEYDDQYKQLCESCPNYGKNFSCPPHSPHFPSYVGEAKLARVVCVRFPREGATHADGPEEYFTRFRMAGRLLSGMLLEYRKEGRVVAGCGPCPACEQCAAEAGLGTCRKPDERIYSLESLGVNVARLLKESFNIDLEWDSEDRHARTVCAVGAAFF